MYLANPVIRLLSYTLPGVFGWWLVGAVAASEFIEHPVDQAVVSSLCEQPDRQTITAIVPVATDHGSYASGIVVDDDRVLTAAHAVQGGGHFFVRIGGTYRSAELVMVNHKDDLAMLAVDTLNLIPLRIENVSPQLFETVWAVGYPRAQSISASSGTFQQFVGNVLHTSATIDPGQSGGGLLSCSHGQWSLIGMLRGYGAYLQGDHYVKLKNHSVSVAGTTINDFLQHN